MSIDGKSGEILDRVSAELNPTEPIERAVRETAAVAIIFRIDGSFLLIRRVVRPDDPWSGQVAFPGGRVEEGDESFKDTASREVREEVGFELGGNARFLGYMESFNPRNRRVSVVPCIFSLLQEVTVVPNREVYSHRWVPFESVSAIHRDRHVLESPGSRLVLPAFRFGDYVVWGLTERILTKLGESSGMAV